MVPERSELIDLERERAVARVFARAKSAWSASSREDDLTRRRASEQRLIAAWPRRAPAVAPARAFVLGVAFATCIAALVVFIQRRESSNAANVASTYTSGAATSTAGAAALAPACPQPALAVGSIAARDVEPVAAPAPVPAQAQAQARPVALPARPSTPTPAPPTALIAAATMPLPPLPSAAATHEVAAPSRMPSADPRAEFTSAELEMASSDHSERAKGRARLSELMTGSDVKLAWDAATLLAQSSSIPAERAAAWARYLATSPPAAYRDRALLDRAEALVEAGQRDEANTIAVDLRGRALPEPRRRKLERIFFGSPR